METGQSGAAPGGAESGGGRRSLLHVMLAWRRGGFLFGAYKRLPVPVRTVLSRFAWRQAWRDFKFAPLPEPVSTEPATAPAALEHPAVPAAINMFGFFGGQFGLGESARLYAAALRGAGASVATVDIDLGLPHARQTLPASTPPNPSIDAVDVVVVNPDYLGRALPAVGAVGPARRFRVGCWFWELGQLPQAWVEAIGQVDAIMVASRFVEDAVAAVTDKPVFRVPLPLSERLDSGLGREAFGLSNSAYVFLASFDFHSSVHRKNPGDVVAAFVQAFPRGDEDVQLLVKSSNGEYYQPQLAALVESARHDPRILIRDQVIDPAHMRALQRCCDAYVSLHRAEGFGLGLAECMAMGKPVIATAWSGNLEFMDAANSCLVDATLVPVAPDQYQYADTPLTWAQPDIAQAVAWMRRLADERDFADALGRVAAADIRERLSPQRVAELLLTRLEAARASTVVGHTE